MALLFVNFFLRSLRFHLVHPLLCLPSPLANSTLRFRFPKLSHVVRGVKCLKQSENQRTAGDTAHASMRKPKFHSREPLSQL